MICYDIQQDVREYSDTLNLTYFNERRVCRVELRLALMRANCLEEMRNGEVKGVGIDGDSR